jgi:SagB-type dehydrogenase family enzyme
MKKSHPHTILKFIGNKSEPWELFHRKTENKSTYKEPKTIPPQWGTIYYKAYQRMPGITLPKTQQLRTPLQETLIKRVSCRSYANEPIALADLSTLLYYSLGVKNIQATERFYPSGGARYPIEGYVIAKSIEGLPSGLYHYYVRTHALEQLLPELPLETNRCFIPPFVKDAAAIVVLTAFVRRSSMKYGNRGYNYTLMEAGHIGQNIQLTATSLGLGSCAIGGFYEEKIRRLLDLDPEEFPLYCFSLGIPTPIS